MMKASTDSAREPAASSYFKIVSRPQDADALSSIFQWQPAPWAIPSASELQSLESFVVFADDDMKLGVPDLLSYEALGFKFFFSVYAIAINYLNRHPSECLQMRNIVVKKISSLSRIRNVMHAV
jgi:hypothetical protein